MMRPILEITEIKTELVIGASDEPPVVLEINEPRVEILTVGVQGPSGTDGADGREGIDGANLKYIHAQASESVEWIVNHNLGSKPVAEVMSAGGEVVEAEVLHISNNQLRVYFSAAFRGFVRCI